jgi:DNA-binding SARP family transcriptional activator
MVNGRKSLGFGLAFFTHWFLVWEALIRRDLARAVSYQPEMLRLALAAGWLRDEAIAQVLSVQILHQHGEEQEARTHLERALEIARRLSSPYFEFMARLAEAELCLDRGQETEGLRALAAAMALGRKGGFVNSDVWQPAVMARLCARALEAGIEVEYVRGLIEKRALVPEKPPMEIEAWPWPVKIYTLGRFRVLRQGTPLSFARKVQRKPLALLKAVIAQGERGAREELLCEALWPEAEGDAAHFALTTAIHRLRRLLGHDATVVRADDVVSLDVRHCWVDAWAVERMLGRAEAAAVRLPQDDKAWDEIVQATERAVDLYQGSFLGGEADLPGATALADRLRRRLLKQVVQLSLRCEGRADWQKAADWYTAALKVDPCAEDASRRLMVACHHLGRPAEVELVYRRCRHALAERLGVTPSSETQALLRNLLAS